MATSGRRDLSRAAHPRPERDPSLYDFYLPKPEAGNYNVAVYRPRALDALLEQSISASNPAKRLATYARILTKLWTDVPYVPIYLEEEKVAIARKFTWPAWDKNWIARPYALEIKAK